MNRVNTDPLVACPIKCGEYMGATGFFFAGGGETYLVTARHNALPTNTSDLRNGNLSGEFATDYFLPTIDVFLRTSDGYEVEHLDIREIDGVKQSPEIDVLAVPFHLDPTEYGYQVWNADDVVSPKESTETLDIIGFDNIAFPGDDREYSPERCARNLGEPATLQMTNPLTELDDLSRFGLMGKGMDTEFVGDDDDYNGLSGSPVLGDGLVGIHESNESPSTAAVAQLGVEEMVLLCYTLAEILPELLGRPVRDGE